MTFAGEPRFGKGTTPRILIIDDELDLRNQIAEALMLEGSCEAATAGDPFEAGYKLARLKPHVVLVDVVMPGMSGLDLCQRIRRFSPETDVKIIVMSAYPDQQATEGSLLEGADLFLAKPFDTNTLLLHIEDLLSA